MSQTKNINRSLICLLTLLMLSSLACQAVLNPLSNVIGEPETGSGATEEPIGEAGQHTPAAPRRETPIPTAEDEIESQASRTPARTPAPTRDAAGPPAAQLAEQLQATAAARLEPTTTPDAHGYSFFSGIEGVQVIPLEMNGKASPLFAVFSQGVRRYDPLQNHFVAVYVYEDGEWEELDRLELERGDYFGVDAVQQVPVEPGHTWMEVVSGAGAHGGCYEVLSFDGQMLESVLWNCTGAPNAGEVRDLNADGQGEVLLNLSENYVFCYACGLRIWFYQVWRWEGGQMREVSLQRLPRPADPELAELNDRAVDLASGELWKDAQEEIQAAVRMDPENETVAWNAVVIDLIAGMRQQQAQGSPYPLLDQVFYGDWAAAMESIRPYTPEEIFTPDGPLVMGTVAQGWEDELHDWVVQFADAALAVEPNLAEAYFLRGWARLLLRPGDSQGLADVRMAASLAPEDDFFRQAVAYLENR